MGAYVSLAIIEVQIVNILRMSNVYSKSCSHEIKEPEYEWLFDRYFQIFLRKECYQYTVQMLPAYSVQ